MGGCPRETQSVSPGLSQARAIREKIAFASITLFAFGARVESLCTA
jgi:hypothetical protein